MFISLSQLKIEVKKAGFFTIRQYKKNRKKHWPSNPDQHYGIKWNEVFGKKPTKKTKFIPLSELRIEVKKLKINTKIEYRKNRKKHWPSNPDQYYGVKWNNLFGKEIKYISLPQLKIAVKKAKINGQIQYKKNRKKHWPSNPKKFYKDEWISWNCLFGRSFNLKKHIIRKLNA